MEACESSSDCGAGDMCIDLSSGSAVDAGAACAEGTLCACAEQVRVGPPTALHSSWPDRGARCRVVQYVALTKRRCVSRCAFSSLLRVRIYFSSDRPRIARLSKASTSKGFFEHRRCHFTIMVGLAPVAHQVSEKGMQTYFFLQAWGLAIFGNELSFSHQTVCVHELRGVPQVHARKLWRRRGSRKCQQDPRRKELRRLLHFSTELADSWPESGFGPGTSDSLSNAVPERPFSPKPARSRPGSHCRRNAQCLIVLFVAWLC